VELELIQGDGRTDMKKRSVAYSNFNNNINNNNLFDLSLLKISEANYRLTFGFHSITSSFFYL
jgi:hypothetical protein